MLGSPNRHSLAACVLSLWGSIGVSELWAQDVSGIDASLFGNKNNGPAIHSWPDTGDGAWMKLETPPAAPPQAAPIPRPTQPPQDFTPRLPIAPRVDDSAAEAPKPKKRRPLLPWNRKKQRDQEKAAEQVKNGPRLSDLKTRTSSDGGSANGDSGLLPSELHRWKRDPRKAMVQARKERKLMLLWLTDSVRIEAGTQLAIELFRHTKFLRLAKDYMVLTRVDYGDNDIASHPYAKTLKEKLNAVGLPFMILVTPDGEEVWRSVGYRPGRFSNILGDLKLEVQRFALKEKYRFEKLEEKGYRFWTNYQNRPMFALAVALSRTDKKVTLQDEYGKRSLYPVLKLSAEDRAYLSERFPKLN